MKTNKTTTISATRITTSGAAAAATTFFVKLLFKKVNLHHARYKQNVICAD